MWLIAVVCFCVQSVTEDRCYIQAVLRATVISTSLRLRHASRQVRAHCGWQSQAQVSRSEWSYSPAESHHGCQPAKVLITGSPIDLSSCHLSLLLSCIPFQTLYVTFSCIPLPSIRQHLSYCASLEDQTEDYQNCSMSYCVTQLYAIICSLIWAVLTGELS